MSDGERCAQTVVLDHRATGPQVADLARLSQAQGVARVGHSAQVLAGQQNGGVVVMRVTVIWGIVDVLPAAEVPKGFRSRRRYQIFALSLRYN